MSSNIYSRLRGLFQQRPASAALATVTGDDPLETLVNLFTKRSNSPNFRRNRLIYKTTVRRLAKAQRYSSIHDILNHQKQYPEITDEHFAARLISLYGQSKMLDHAIKLFDEMPHLKCPRSVLSFNALLGACVSSEELDKVGELFSEIPKKLSIEPDIISYNTVIKAFCDVGQLDAAVAFLDEIEKNGLKPNVVTFNTLLGTLYKGDIEKFSKAETLWNLMKEKEVVPDVRSYNCRLHGMLRQKRVSETLNVFKEIEDKGLKPNHYSYNTLFNGFMNEGDLEAAKKWYGAMISSGCAPNFLTFSTLVALACSKNDFGFAHQLCMKSVELKKVVSRQLMQKVVDGLIEQSEVDKANELLKFRESNGRNSMPADD